MELNSKVVEKNEISEELRLEMYKLMDEHYDCMNYENFIMDLEEKEYSILLFFRDELVGFSTQKILNIQGDIFGVFSGDTIIHKNYWGSIELYKAFANFFIILGEKFPKFYWFLISKGYKTYKMLPLFFQEFYPNYRSETPNDYQNIIKLFGEYKYPNEFCNKTGVIKYSGFKDRLKNGVAELSEKHFRDPHVKFFLEKNPKYWEGEDLVCITELSKKNLKPRIKKLLLGDEI